MNLSTVEIPRTDARAEAASYARAARHEADPDRARELERMARAYRTVASTTNVGLISLTATIRAGGTVTRTRVQSWWNGTERRWTERRDDYLLPRLAVCRWQAAFCYSGGVRRSGWVEYADSLGRRPNYRAGVLDVDAGFELPDSYHQGFANAAMHSAAWCAMVPIVPPKHRPARGMGERLVLWEVENWEWTAPPRAPGDPALLRHVAGDIYAVEAVWELTELERLVLSERRP